MGEKFPAYAPTRRVQPVTRTPNVTRTPKLLILDVDNTLFDWLSYYASSNSALLATLGEMIDVPYPVLVEEFKSVMAHYDKNGNSFVLPELPSMSSRLHSSDISEINHKCAAVFLQKATSALVPYPGAMATLTTIKRYRPYIKIIALTDSPCLEAVWKIDQLGLAPHFDGIYGLNTPPVIPTPQVLNSLTEAWKKFSGRTRLMPPEYAKPSTKGLETIMADYGLNLYERDRVVYVGDNFKKDIALGKKAGVLTCWSEFGSASDSPWLQETLNLSPAIKISQNVPDNNDLRQHPDVTLRKFSDLLHYIF